MSLHFLSDPAKKRASLPIRDRSSVLNLPSKIKNFCLTLKRGLRVNRHS